MAYTLKTSGLATALTFCLAVDSDGVTLKEFVSSDVNTNKVVGTCTFGTQAWKGTSRAYFKTGGSGSSPSGISFPAGHQAGASEKGLAYFFAIAKDSGASGTIGYRHLIDSDGASIGRDQSTNNIVLYTNDNSWKLGLTGTLPAPDGVTPFSYGANFSNSTVSGYDTNGIQLYWGLESGSTALNNSTTASVSGNGTSHIRYIGGFPAAGTWNPACHIICQFNRELTAAEYTSLHNDWFGTLFDTAVGNPAPTFPGPNIADMSGSVGVAISSVDVSSKFSDTDTLTFSAVGSWPPGITISSVGVISGTPTTGGTYPSLTVRATDTASQTVDSNAFIFTVAAHGTITTAPLKNNAGTLLTSQSAATAYVYNPTTGALIVKLTGQTTNASGVMTLTDATIAVGTSYRVVIALSSGAEGMGTYTAA